MNHFSHGRGVLETSRVEESIRRAVLANGKGGLKLLTLAASPQSKSKFMFTSFSVNGYVMSFYLCPLDWNGVEGED
jgi:hypothetical protein